MKKLIVISLVFALAAASVFAVDVTIEVQGGATIIGGSTAEFYESNGDIYDTEYTGTSFNMGLIRIGASGETEDGKLGAWLRVDGSYTNYETSYSIMPAGFAWWKPADFFKLQIGYNPDGEFGLDGITGWGFYEAACDVGVAVENWEFSSAFFGGWGAPGIILSSNPIEALTISLGIPLIETNYNSTLHAGSNYAYQNYKDSTLQIKYDIEGTGTVGFTFIGNQMEKDPVFNFNRPNEITNPTAPVGITNIADDNPKIYAYFGLTANEDFSLDFGIGYRFSDTYDYENTVSLGSYYYTTKTTSTVNEPLAVGVGLNLKSGSFGLKARVLGEFLGSITYDYNYTTSTGASNWSFSETVSTGYKCLFDILPYFAINDKFTLYVSAGFGLTGGAEELYYKLDSSNNPVLDNGNPSFEHKTQDSEFTWHLNPYISINYGAGSFFAGIRIESPSDTDAKDKAYINWSVPIGIAISF